MLFASLIDEKELLLRINEFAERLIGNEMSIDEIATLPRSAFKSEIIDERGVGLLALAYGLTRISGEKYIDMASRFLDKAFADCRECGGSGTETLLINGRIKASQGRGNLAIKNIRFFLKKNTDITQIDNAIAMETLGGIALRRRDTRTAAELLREWYEQVQSIGSDTLQHRALWACMLIGALMGSSFPDSMETKINDIDDIYFSILRAMRKIFENGPGHGENPALLESIRNNIESVMNGNTQPLLLDAVALLPTSLSNIPENLATQSELDFSSFLSLLLMYYAGFTEKNLERDLARHISQWGLANHLKVVYDDILAKNAEEYYTLVVPQMTSRGVYDYLKKYHLTRNSVQKARDAVVIMIDMVGYSTLSENMPPEHIFEVLSPLFKMFMDRISESGGSAIEFIGDAILAVFNVFKDNDVDIYRILLSCTEFLDELLMHRCLNSLKGIPDLDIGMGIMRGPLALGSFGSLMQSHVTVLGNNVNIAARLESKTRNLPGKIALTNNYFGSNPANIWEKPEHVGFTIRNMGIHKIKNINESVNIYAVNSLVNGWIDFVPMGYTAVEEDGVLYIDTGGRKAPGIIDHHSSDEANSACELFMKNPGYFLAGIKNKKPFEIEFRLHSMPDIDCTAALYAIQECLRMKPRLKLLKKLAAYISEIDQGKVPEPESFTDSLSGIFLGHLKCMSEKENGDLFLLKSGLVVIDAAMYIAQEKKKDVNFAHIFKEHQNIFSAARNAISDDFQQYQNDLSRAREYEGYIVKNNARYKANGLWLENPKSMLFKTWTRNPINNVKRYEFMTVCWTSEKKNRYVISVDPELNLSLNGLGQELERHETMKRRESGQDRPSFPKRFLSDNADPWYYGQGHNYTIVDSPFCGSLLSPEEVMKIHGTWGE